MTCPEVVSRLDDLVDGELPSDQATRVREHIQACASCRQEYDRTVQVKRLLASSAPVDPGAEYFVESESHILARTVGNRVFEEVRQLTAAESRTARRTSLLRALLSVAASIGILFAAIYLGSRDVSRLAQLNDPSSPILATVDIQPFVGVDLSPVLTQEDQLRLTRGMMLMGSPGILGRFSAVPEIIRTNPTDES